MRGAGPGRAGGPGGRGGTAPSGPTWQQQLLSKGWGYVDGTLTYAGRAGTGSSLRRR